jgi:5-methylcytosine-specific restriction endonuclease McrA
VAEGWNGRRVTALRDVVLAIYGPVCWLCNAPIAFGQDWDVDHVVARSRCPVCRGKSWCETCNRIENIRPAHAACNRGRGAGESFVWAL